MFKLVSTFAIWKYLFLISATKVSHISMFQLMKQEPEILLPEILDKLWRYYIGNFILCHCIKYRVTESHSNKTKAHVSF